MRNKSKNDCFEIKQLKNTGLDIEKNSISVCLIPRPIVGNITLLKLAEAVMDCFEEWTEQSIKFMPVIYFDMYVNNRRYKFKVHWNSGIEGYLREIASQLML